MLKIVYSITKEKNDLKYTLYMHRNFILSKKEKSKKYKLNIFNFLALVQKAFC